MCSLYRHSRPGKEQSEPDCPVTRETDQRRPPCCQGNSQRLRNELPEDEDLGQTVITPVVLESPPEGPLWEAGNANDSCPGQRRGIASGRDRIDFHLVRNKQCQPVRLTPRGSGAWHQRGASGDRPRCFQGVYGVKSTCLITGRGCWPIFLSLSCKHSGVFQKLSDLGCCHHRSDSWLMARALGCAGVLQCSRFLFLTGRTSANLTHHTRALGDPP